MKTIRGKKALVTGAASGIGRAIALHLAAEGADVCLVDIDAAGLCGVADEVRAAGSDVLTSHCDVSRADQIANTVELVVRQWGGVDILVNNAGIAYYGPTAKMKADDWDRILDINLRAPVRFVQLLLNVASFMGLLGFGRLTGYCTSKFGLVGLSESLRYEYRRLGLGVTAVCPGWVKTGIYSAAGNLHDKKDIPQIPEWLCTTPEKIAAQTVRAIRRNRGVVVPTLHARFMVGMKRYFPSVIDWLYGLGRRRAMRKKAARLAEKARGQSPAAPTKETAKPRKAA